MGDRHHADPLTRSSTLTALDPDLASLLAQRPALDVRTSATDLYVIAASGGFSAALPKAAARSLRESAMVTLEAVDTLGTVIAETFLWFDRVLAHLQRVVCARAEDGLDLLERWSSPDWAIIATLESDDVVLDYLPRVDRG